MTFIGKPAEKPERPRMRQFRVHLCRVVPGMGSDRAPVVEAHYVVTDKFLKFYRKTEGNGADFLVEAFHSSAIVRFTEIEP